MWFMDKPRENASLRLMTVSGRPIALTCGDPSGIGPEVIARWLTAYPEYREKVVAVGPARWIASLGVRGVPVGDADHVATPGKPDAAGQRLALAAMERAARGCASGEFAAVVTGPVSKSGLQSVGFTHPGQTEFFAEAWGGEPVMGFAGDRMRVILATWHIPLSEVPGALTREGLARAVAAAGTLCRSQGVAEPRIAVCGLNPHAGENGVLGTDERDRLDPWLDAIRRDHPGVSKCLPGDTVFFRHLRGDFDAVVAMYHDQGLAPVKTLEFDSAVNVTLGLPHVRTSPDHGTAYDIAGENIADHGSWHRAVVLAERLSSQNAK